MINNKEDHTIMLAPDQLEKLRNEYKMFQNNNPNEFNQNSSKSIDNIINLLKNINIDNMINKKNVIIAFIILSSLIIFLIYYNISKANKKAMTEKAIYHFNIGNSYFNERQWNEAINQYNEVLKNKPDYLNVENLIQQSKYEIINHSIMQESDVLINENNDYEQAIKKLKFIKQDSIYYNEAIEKIEFAQNEIKRIINIKNKANSIIEEILNEYAKGRIESSIKQLDELLELALPKDSLIKDKAIHLKEKMVKVKNSYEEGYERFRNKQYKKAFECWSCIFDIDRKIIGNKISYYTSQIGKYFLEYYYIQASSDYDKGKYSEAYMKCNKVLQSWPDHHGCLEINNMIIPKLNK